MESVCAIWLACECTSDTIAWLSILVVLTAVTDDITTPRCAAIALEAKSLAVAVSSSLPV